MFDTLAVDMLVLGGGGAGVMAALHAWQRDPTLRIAVAAKGLIAQSGCTRMVQGGYNAVLDPRDSLDLHFTDTLRAGGWINDQELAWALVSDAPERIRELERLGCFFDRTPEGRVHQKPFAGQSFDRTVHRGDLTGIEIMTRLKEQLLGAPATLLDEHRALELLHDAQGGISGALLLDIRSGRSIAVSAPVTVVATGGGARMYRIAAPSLEKSGDGMALCYRAGCVMQDMEQFQFHPTGLMAGDSVLTGAVLEEGLRGSGGHMYNAKGERFMSRYDPERMERATRDVVARASYLEIQAGRGTPDGAVLLDVSHLGADFVEKSFPGMVARCREAGYDLAREPVKVSPTAHFHMGGARIDPRCHTSLPGLLAAGEDAAGTHGANRLGGNGVAESIVFGARAGDQAAEEARSRRSPRLDPSEIEAAIAQAVQPMQRSGGENVFRLRRQLEGMMWDKAGLVRDQEGLLGAKGSIEELAAQLGQASVPPSREYSPAWQEWLNLRSLLTVARLLVASALARTESRGSHYRRDYPQRDDSRWLRNMLVRQGKGGEPEVWTDEVKFTRKRPPVA
ncbi:MAG: FAD-binding protein [Chloroflexi bacterium]|nr:FAD-binding protein [Chloroflexota bacterium]